jgi:hypothetical protein
VPQHPKDLLQSAVALQGDNLMLRYLRDVRAALALHRLSDGGLVRELALPGLGSVGGFSGSRKGTEFFYSFQSFVEPGATYRGDTADAGAPPALLRATKLSVPHDPDDYEVTQARCCWWCVVFVLCCVCFVLCCASCCCWAAPQPHKPPTNNKKTKSRSLRRAATAPRCRCL